MADHEKNQVKWYGYVVLVLGILFFSGIFTNFDGPLRALDFTTLTGAFGRLGDLAEESGTLAANFKGTGGSGAKDAWMLALTLVPSVMLALGVIKVIEYYDGLMAAKVLLSPILRLIMGIPGVSGLALIGSLQSADVGASMAKDLVDQKLMSQKERLIFCSFHFPCPAIIVNYFSLGAVLIPFLSVAPVVPLAVIFICKLIGANIVRIYAQKFVTEED